MIVRPPELSPQLEAVLAHLIKRRTSLNMTEAVKLPYLVDVIANHALGAPITDTTYEAWGMGVVAAEVWHNLDGVPEFAVEPVPNSGAKRVSVTPYLEPIELTKEQEQVIDFVADLFGPLYAVELGEITKRMNPGIAHWGNNEPADIGPDAYDRLSDEYQKISRLASSITAESLDRHSVQADSIEEMLA